MTHSLFAARLADATQRGLEREVGERPRNEDVSACPLMTDGFTQLFWTWTWPNNSQIGIFSRRDWSIVRAGVLEAFLSNAGM